jgi:hypothetical protein
MGFQSEIEMDRSRIDAPWYILNSIGAPTVSPETHSVHCKKRVCHFPVPSIRDVTKQTLPAWPGKISRENWLVTSRLETEKPLTFFYSVDFGLVGKICVDHRSTHAVYI